jgi:hypothetical protein
MAQIATLLSDDECKRFGSYLYNSTEQQLELLSSKREQREFRQKVYDALSQPSLNRLRTYAQGAHFPTPRILSKLAFALGQDPITLLMMAGYQREVLPVLQRLYLVSRKHGKPAEDLKSAAIAYAVLVFPRRGERYRPGSEPWDGVGLTARTIVPFTYAIVAEEVHQRITLRALRIAYECLGEPSIAMNVERRRMIAGEVVRSWAYDVDAQLARSSEASTYLPTPAEYQVLPSRPKLMPVVDLSLLITEENNR